MHQPVLLLYPLTIGSLTCGASLCMQVLMTALEPGLQHQSSKAEGPSHVQEMMQVMVSERGGKLYSIDDRYCIDNGAMIAWPGLLAFKQGQVTPFEETTCTQRFRTDDVLVTWRD